MTVPTIVKGQTLKPDCQFVGLKRAERINCENNSVELQGSAGTGLSVCDSNSRRDCMEEKTIMIRMTWFSDATVPREPAPD